MTWDVEVSLVLTSSIKVVSVVLTSSNKGVSAVTVLLGIVPRSLASLADASRVDLIAAVELADILSV